MARKYQVNGVVRFVNRIGASMIRRNLGPQQNYLLTVNGRKTGKPYTTPVTLVVQNGNRWLVSPYGEVNWVKNARATGEVSLSRGGKTEMLKIQELDPKTSAPILKTYLHAVPYVRPYFNARPDSPLEAFEAEASQHSVFLLEEK
jgi:deazaflavin-dependent oxidoreductase (nitroreductase family)